MAQAGDAKFGRDNLLGRWDNHVPEPSTSSAGEPAVSTARRHLTILYAYRRAGLPQRQEDD